MPGVGSLQALAERLQPIGLVREHAHGGARQVPLLRRLPLARGALGRRVALGAEFAVLFFALLLSVGGGPGYAWAYAAYTAFNIGAAWLILSRRV